MFGNPHAPEVVAKLDVFSHLLQASSSPWKGPLLKPTYIHTYICMYIYIYNCISLKV
jgi:hypothetical protein